MSVPTVNYFSTQLPCKLKRLSHGGNSFCLPASKTVVAKPLTSPTRRHLSLAQSADSGGEKPSWGGETSDNHFAQCLALATWSSRASCSSSSTLFLPSPNNRHHFLIFPSSLHLHHTLRGRVGCLRQPTLRLSIRINTGSLYRNVSILNYKRDKDNVS